MHSKQRYIAVTLLAVASVNPLAADEKKPMPAAEFKMLHQMFRPQTGESRWMEIDWYPNVWEARQKAAAEGKPIFLMAGSGGAPPAGC